MNSKSIPTTRDCWRRTSWRQSTKNTCAYVFGVLSAMEALPDFARACCRQISTPPSEWSWTETVDEFTKVNMGQPASKTGENGSLMAAAGGKPVVAMTLRRHEIALAYSHSCGWSTNRTNDSTTCRKGKAGHNKEATAHDNKGSCQKIAMKKRGRSVNKPKPKRSNGGSSTGSAG
jgi:hypothetical protein